MAAALSKYVPGMQATAEVTGGSVAGNLCFVVPEADRGTETLYVSAGFVSDTYEFLATK